MLYIFNSGDIYNSASIVYDKTLVPQNIKPLVLEKLPSKPDEINEYILKITPTNTAVYWELNVLKIEKLHNLKRDLINKSKELLKNYLVNNPLYSNAHNNIYKYYNVTEEKQTLLTSEFMGYQVMKTAGIDTSISWNATNEPCEIWQENEIIQLIGEMRAYVKPLVTYQQKKELEINSALTEEELNNIVIDYNSVHENIIFNDTEENSSNRVAENIILIDDVK